MITKLCETCRNYEHLPFEVDYDGFCHHFKERTDKVYKCRFYNPNSKKAKEGEK